MKKIIVIISILIIFNFLVLWYFTYNYLPKINNNTFFVNNQKDKNNRENIKSTKLQKEIVLFVKNHNFRENINLNLYKDYFVINWNYCDLNNDFFIWLEEKLKSKNIIFKPKIDINSDLIINWYKNLWKKLKLNNIKYNICSFVNSENKFDYIELEIENYEYDKKILDEIKDYKLVWNYSIDKYFKTPLESVLNSQNLIEKISFEIINPNENISILEKLLNNWWKDLLSSNILKDWEIIKWIWWWSCLASTIIYRTILNAWIDVISQKTHNIYYENIYWNWEIWLDSTIYEDEKYYVDLLFKNNYKNPIIFLPTFTNNSIMLNIYSKEIEYKTKLEQLETKNIENIKWKYEIFDKNNNKIKESIIFSKYDKIDNF